MQLQRDFWARVAIFNTGMTAIGNIRTGLGRLYRIIHILANPRGSTAYQVKARSHDRLRRIRTICCARSDWVERTDYNCIEELSQFVEKEQRSRFLTTADRNNWNGATVTADEEFTRFVRLLWNVMQEDFASRQTNMGSQVDLPAQRMMLAAYDTHNSALGDLKTEVPRLYTIIQTVIHGTADPTSITEATSSGI